MKTVQVDGLSVTVILARGQGDGGAVVCYFVDEGDGTYSEKQVWWSDPKLAQEVYDNAGDDYLKWTKDDARRRLVAVKDRAPEQPQPDPTAKISLRG